MRRTTRSGRVHLSGPGEALGAERNPKRKRSITRTESGRFAKRSELVMPHDASERSIACEPNVTNKGSAESNPVRPETTTTTVGEDGSGVSDVFETSCKQSDDDCNNKPDRRVGQGTSEVGDIFEPHEGSSRLEQVFG